jgi:hypothetical protein
MMDCDPRMWVMALLRLLVGVALLLAAAALVRDLTSGGGAGRDGD